MPLKKETSQDKHLLSQWKELEEEPLPDLFQDFPVVSIIVPVLNDDAFIKGTIDSVLNQNYPNKELIVVDGGSKDQTLLILEGYRKQIDFIDFIQTKNLYTQMNRGVELAQGAYINFLMPGDSILSYDTVARVMVDAKKGFNPDLIYGGVLLRPYQKEPFVLNRPFSHPNLKRGKQPTSLEACYFNAKLLRDMGGFPEDFLIRGGCDLLTDLAQRSSARVVRITRVVVEQKELKLEAKTLWSHFKETARIVKSHFGFRALFAWFLTQTHLRRLFFIYLQKIRFSFFGYQ